MIINVTSTEGTRSGDGAKFAVNTDQIVTAIRRRTSRGECTALTMMKGPTRWVQETPEQIAEFSQNRVHRTMQPVAQMEKK